METSTIIHDYLAIEAEEFSVPHSVYDRIEQLMQQAESCIDSDEPLDVLSNISVVLADSGLEYGEDALVGRNLEDGEVNCKGMSLLYSSIGERTSADIDVVHVPNHVFVRWSGDEPIHWETVADYELRGEQIDEQEYLSDFNISQEAVRNDVYFNALSRDELKALAYLHRGAARDRKEDDLEEAVQEFKEALDHAPGFQPALIKLSAANIWQEAYQEALEHAEQALKQDSEEARAYLYRGYAHEELDNPEAAVEDYTEAKDIGIYDTYHSAFIALDRIQQQLDREADEQQQKLESA